MLTYASVRVDRWEKAGRRSLATLSDAQEAEVWVRPPRLTVLPLSELRLQRDRMRRTDPMPSRLPQTPAHAPHTAPQRVPHGAYTASEAEGAETGVAREEPHAAAREEADVAAGEEAHRDNPLEPQRRGEAAAGGVCAPSASMPTVPPPPAAAAAAAAVAPGSACVAAGPEVTVSLCVPTGPILSSEKELMEQWRASNHLLIPHFAKMEQAKSFNASLDRSAPRIPS
jgi:hypothetical protein